MNKEELIEAISEASEYSKADTKRFLEAYLQVTQDALVAGETIQLVGSFTLSVGDRAARKGRNPQTGKEIQIAASRVVKFSAGKQLKEAVNNAKSSSKASASSKTTAKKKK